MFRMIAKLNRRSRKGITLVELIVAMTMTAMFAVVCVALLNPISKMYLGTVKLSQAQLLGDAIIDSIRKECDGIKTDESTTAWIAKLNESDADDGDLLENGSARKTTNGEGNVLVIQKNSNYAEAIYACLPLSKANYDNAHANPVQGDKAGHAIDRILPGGVYSSSEPNVQKGIVHFGYYQAKEDKRGIFPFRAYDYTNPVLASTYGKFKVKLTFKSLELRDDKYPAFCMCEVVVSENGSKVYSRTAVISFSANGSGIGSGGGGGGGHSEPTKNVDVTVRWVDSTGATITWPSEVPSITVTLKGASPVRTQTVYPSNPRFSFGGVKLTGKPSLQLSDVTGYTHTYTGNSDSGYYVIYKADKVENVKLVSGSYIKGKLGTEVTNVIFGKYDDYKDQVAGVSSLDFAVDIDQTSDAPRKSDYRYFRVGTTAYILSEDGTFIANEKCNDMFNGCSKLESITWPMANNAFDTSRTTTMKNMFLNCKSLKQFNLPDRFVRSACTDLEKMFEECNSVTYIRIKSWNTSGVTTMNRMFMNFANSTNVSDKVSVDLSSFSFDNCTKLSKLFYNDKKVNDKSVSRIVKITFPTTMDVPENTTFDATLSGLSELEYLENFKNINGPKVTTLKNLLHNCYKLGSKDGGVVDISGCVMPVCTSFEGAFGGLESMTTLKINNCNFSKCTNVNSIFKDSTNLDCIEMKNSDFSALDWISWMNIVTDLDLSGSTFGSKGLEQTFASAKSSKVETLNLTGTRFPKCTTAKNMFAGSPIKTVIFKDLYAPNLTDCTYMFNGCPFTEFTLSDFKISACTKIEYMFNNCTSLKKITISDVELAKCETALNMFNNCYELNKVSISNFVTPKLTSCQGMFQNCYSLSISAGDVTGWDTSSVKNMSFMFQHACFRGGSYTSLPKTAELDVSFISFAGATNLAKMFNCDSTGNDTLTRIVMPTGANAKVKSASVDINRMFRKRDNVEEIVNLNEFTVENAISDATSLFAECGARRINISSLDLSKISAAGAQWMFSNCERLEKIYVSAATDYDNVPMKTTTQIFKVDSGSSPLTGEHGTAWSSAHITGEYARIDDPDNGKPGYFSIAPTT